MQYKIFWPTQKGNNNKLAVNIERTLTILSMVVMKPGGSPFAGAGLAGIRDIVDYRLCHPKIYQNKQSCQENDA